MPLIQFTRNHSDHSTDKGYQFEFFCDRCGNGFMSEFKASAKRMLCYDCAPDIETELASAQVQETVEQMKEKLRQTDLTKSMNLTAEATALCPACGARTQGAKFCPECGKPLRAKNECGRCGTH